MPMNNQEWLDAWRGADRVKRYQLVERLARARLDDLIPGTSLTTAQLCEALFPVMQERGPGIAVRKAIMLHLMSLAKGTMKDCATKNMDAEPRMWMGKAVRPWIWKRGNAARKAPCPCCAGKGYRDVNDTCQPQSLAEAEPAIA